MLSFIEQIPRSRRRRRRKQKQSWLKCANVFYFVLCCFVLFRKLTAVPLMFVCGVAFDIVAFALDILTTIRFIIIYSTLAKE